MPSLHINSITDIGNNRENNEDFLGCFDFSAQLPLSTPVVTEIGPLGIGVFVSDGMGGAKGGEIASKMTIEGISGFLIENLAHRELLHAEAVDTFLEAINYAHDQIIETSYLEMGLSGMGATFSGCFFLRSSLLIGHIGDSRVYKIANNTITQLSNDHSPVGRLVRSGAVSPDQARFHPNNHLLDQALGANMNFINPDIIEESYQAGDKFLICTDGLHDSLGDKEILKIIKGSNNDEECLQELIFLTKKTKGTDNISASLVTVA